MGATHGPRLEVDLPSGEDYSRRIVEAAEIDTIPGVRHFTAEEGEHEEMYLEVFQAVEAALEEAFGTQFPDGVFIRQVNRRVPRLKITLEDGQKIERAEESKHIHEP